MSKLVKWDQELFIYLNNLGSEQWDGFWMFMTGHISWYLLLALIVFLSYKKYKSRFWISLIIILSTYVITDYISVHWFKEVFQRLRPCHQEGVMEFSRLVKDGCGGQWGFVSSHAANSMAVAWLTGLLFPVKIGRFNILLIGLIIWASIVSYSRVYVGVHYVGDILMGAILGKWIALAAFGIQHLIKRNR